MKLESSLGIRKIKALIDKYNRKMITKGVLLQVKLQSLVIVCSI